MHSQHAFTLMEMLLTLAIIALIATMAFPSIQVFLARQQDDIVQRDVLQAIQFARQAASVYGVPMVICKTNTNQQCAADGMAGLLIFTDQAGTGTVDDPRQILAVKQIKRPHHVLHWRSFPRYRAYLRISPLDVTSQDNGTFWYCDDRDAIPKWAIFVNKSARTRTVYPDQKGEIKDAQGKRLGCDENLTRGRI